MNRLTTLLCAALLSGLAIEASDGAPLNLSDAPLFLTTSVAPLNMLAIGRDHKLYYEAYNDASDINDDGVLDVRYKPTQIDYYGYFDSHKCYNYSSGVFVPVSISATKKCSGNWSGDFLNYITTARIDALRKVLYGGSRYIDSATDTVLQRTVLPQDAHSWGKDYESAARDGYNISEYTPYSLPAAGTRHLFANTTLISDSTQLPRMRVLLNRPNRIWEWLSIERPVAGNEVVTAGVRQTLSAGSFGEFAVRVRVCVSGLLEANCRSYASGSSKPIGLLQEYGESDRMLFGLVTGTYAKNTQGGILRKRVGTFRDEINMSTGQFLNVAGILQTLDRFRVVGFNSAYEYSCGWIATRPINAGECEMWGNPTAEMMYETIRYFAGKGAPTSAFDIAASGNTDATLGLPHPSWDNPYSSASRSCAKPFETVISDINPSYDTDQVPGSYFNSFTGDLTGLNVTTLGNSIWSAEYGGSSRVFIGQSAGTFDGAPTPKTATSFGSIRGLAPEEPTKNGGYYAASIAYYGLTRDQSAATGSQKVQTFAVALTSPLPRIDIAVGASRIRLIPFAKSVGGAFSISNAAGSFQPTNQIVDFYVETITPTYGRFRVNFEDVEQGADHDMDAIAIYEYTVNANNTVTVSVTSEYAAGSIVQHMGYVISGSTADGTYLVVRDVDTNSGAGNGVNYPAGDVDYFLDTPNVSGPLPLTSSRTFSPGTTAAATLLKDPLWYAAKWGGFKDANQSNTPDQAAEWDEDNDGDPDNYFLVTNALTLSQKLASAFDEIIGRVGSAASASVNSGSINSETRVFQALFSSADWSGELLSQPVNDDGTFSSTGSWKAAALIPAADSRKILTVNASGAATPFRWASLDTAQKDALKQTDSNAIGSDRLDYLRGLRTKEQQNGGTLRNRSSALGDIINSAPAFVGKPAFRYPDTLEPAAYSAFQTAQADRRQSVYVGSNDGMLHAFRADTGQEMFAFIPYGVFANLYKLTQPSYAHRYFVDGTPTTGDAYIGGNWQTVLVSGLNGGGQSVFALNVTRPETVTESSGSTLFLWEYTDTQDKDLGYTYSRPSIVRLKNGKWAAVFGNGYNNTASDSNISTTGNAALYIVDLQTGSLIRKITTGVGIAQDPSGQSRPNGLATPALVDVNDDNVVDYGYAGDLFGNLWKFNLTDSNPNNWNVAYASGTTRLPLFVAQNASGVWQPITSKPSVSRGPNGQGLIVLFGTGKYLEPIDENVANLTTQTSYGVIDQNAGTSSDIVTGRGQLTQQRITNEFTAAFEGNSVDARVTTTNALGSNRGWYIDLVSPANGFEGEMQVTDSVVRDGHVLFTTLIPNADLCAYGGRSWLMEMSLFTGSRLDNTPFDLDGDGKFNDQDFVTVQGGGTSVRVPVSGIQTTVGVTPKPAILSSNKDGGCDYLIMPGTSGDMETRCRNPGPRAFGRQSWRQAH